jgi:hypothetical protein
VHASPKPSIQLEAGDVRFRKTVSAANAPVKAQAVAKPSGGLRNLTVPQADSPAVSNGRHLTDHEA